MMFNTVYTHLWKQGRSSVREVGPREAGFNLPGGKRVACAYRAPNGDMCAVGVLMSDALYSPELESQSVYGLNGYPDFAMPQTWRDNLTLLREMQQAHDDLTPYTDTRLWRKGLLKRFERIAKDHNLDTAVMER